ncbi:MAG: hypothetical protein Q9N34_06285 [Aquificota bacterium]|nr:hypothetical protein [Aquificota bacterium]
MGEEEGKGNELVRETYPLLKQTGLNFAGNAEGRDIYAGTFDVIVCDGFIGNVILKASESLGMAVVQMIKEESKERASSQSSELFCSCPPLHGSRKRRTSRNTEAYRYSGPENLL